jgi:hypothetical protein
MDDDDLQEKEEEWSEVAGCVRKWRWRWRRTGRGGSTEAGLTEEEGGAAGLGSDYRRPRRRRAAALKQLWLGRRFLCPANW